jgi:hypothetical protein
MQWDAMVRHEAKIWTEFNRFWLNHKSIPVLVIRFEDLIMYRELTLRRVCCFMWGLPQPMKFLKLPDNFNHNFSVNDVDVEKWNDDALFDTATPRPVRHKKSFGSPILASTMKKCFSMSLNHHKGDSEDTDGTEEVAIPPSITEQNRRQRWDMAGKNEVNLYGGDSCTQILGM